MIHALIIADDLTGAMDTAVHFAAQGLKTHVFMKAVSPDLRQKEDIQLLAVNTESRHISPSAAYQTVFDLVSQAKALGIPCIYKKTDSALRGNAGAELCAMYDALQSSPGSKCRSVSAAASDDAGNSSCTASHIIHSLPFIPAYPRLGRTIEGGMLFVDGVPVTESAFARDPLNPVVSSDVLSILLETVPPERQEDFSGIIQIYDAKTDQDLLQLGEMLDDKTAFCAGCGGFAEVLAALWAPRIAGSASLSGAAQEESVNGFENKPAAERKNNVFLVCGSLHEKSLSQTAEAARRGYPAHILARHPFPELKSRIRNDLQTKHISILSTGDYLRPQAVPPNPGHFPAKKIKALVKELCDDCAVDTLCVFGGDTLACVMDALGIRTLHVLKELAPGVVKGMLEYGGRQIFVISKAGSFGNRELIPDLFPLSSKLARES